MIGSEIGKREIDERERGNEKDRRGGKRGREIERNRIIEKDKGARRRNFFCEA